MQAARTTSRSRSKSPRSKRHLALCKHNGDACIDIASSRRMARPRRATGWPDSDRGSYIIFELLNALYLLLKAVRAEFEDWRYLPSRAAVPPSSSDFLELRFCDERDRFQLGLAVRAREVVVTLAAIENATGVRNKTSKRVDRHRAEFVFQTDEYLPNAVGFTKANISEVRVANVSSRNRASFAAKPFYKILRTLSREHVPFQVPFVIDGSLSGAAKRSFQIFSLCDNFFACKIEPLSFRNDPQKAEYLLTEDLSLILV